MNNFSQFFQTTVTTSLAMSTFLMVQNPANAIVFDWQFNGEGGFSNVNLTGTVSGTVEFQDSSFIANQTVSATSLIITSAGDITGSPFFGDGFIELDTNLVSLSGSANSYTNSFVVNPSADGFNNLDFDIYFSGSPENERFALSSIVVSPGGNERSFLFNFNYPTDTSTSFEDSDSSSLTFTRTEVTTVPFEFSPILGFVIVGGVWSIKYFKLKDRS